ncbi:MAG: hypothetical protein KDK08_26815, partial [Rhizobiaceae bacterium]|nr:hypothetical protein [Rhizobiaceae bacterium]
ESRSLRHLLRISRDYAAFRSSANGNHPELTSTKATAAGGNRTGGYDRKPPFIWPTILGEQPA